MKKLIMVFLCLISAALVATDDKKNDTVKKVIVDRKQSLLPAVPLLPSAPRSMTPLASPESSDNELSDDEYSDDDSYDSSSDDTSSDEEPIDARANKKSALANLRYEQRFSIRTLLEAYGGRLMGSTFFMLIAYKIYRAGYLL